MKGGVRMEDTEIVALYWARDQRAITESGDKYGTYCASIARNILGSPEDAEECVSDTWFRAWNAMPPQRPGLLSAFFGRITRNLAFDRFRSRSALKRGGAETALVLEELRDCVSGKEDPEQRLDEKELMADLNAFLRRLPPDKRRLFLRRYFYAEPIYETAKLFGMKENQVAVTLHRLRKQLREYLRERGHEL